MTHIDMHQYQKDLDTHQYQKDCACVGATATTCQFRVKRAYVASNQFFATMAFIPGPSCDKCGRAWKWTRKKKKKE